MSERGFFDALEAQLDAGFDDARSRRVARRRLLQRSGALALGLVAVVAVFGLVLRDEPAAAGVSVEQRDGLVYVRLTDIEHRAEVIEEAAAAAGLSVRVEEIPTGPSLVGRFVGYEQEGQAPGELRELDRDGPAFSGFTIPAGYDGHLELLVGRPAKGREPYRHFTNALSPGEPLACSGILGVAPGVASSIVTDHGLDATWLVTDEGDTRVVATKDLPEAGGLRVIRAQSVGTDAVSIALSDGSAPPPAIELTADAAC